MLRGWSIEVFGFGLFVISEQMNDNFYILFYLILTYTYYYTYIYLLTHTHTDKRKYRQRNKYRHVTIHLHTSKEISRQIKHKYIYKLLQTNRNI